jgi:uncharacterized protein (TIGR03790 family)
MSSDDALGRRKIAIYQHRLAALVVCRGVPLRIDHDPARYVEHAPFTKQAEFRTNAGAVDAELSLLAQPNYPINAFVLNPLFQNDRPRQTDRDKVVLVTRLDGVTVDDALALVDRALAAERTGLLGRAYVDIANRDQEGDGWFEQVAKQLAELGFDTDVDRAPTTMPATARCDAAALYFGWYAGQVDGPWATPGFQFAPGAIALHLHSYSATTLRSPTGGWTAPFVAHGATATVGNVFEPYLRLTHHPHLLLRALARGATLAEAACYALPTLSWQQTVLGDPLYRPFAVPLAEQLKTAAQLAPRLAGYAALRQARLLDAAQRPAEADALLVAAQRDTPSLAVGLALSRRRLAAGDRDGAGNALGFAPLLKNFRPDERALARDAAQQLAATGRPARALEVWRALLASSLPAELRAAWLPDAIGVARAAGDTAQSGAWETEIRLAEPEKK